MLGSSEDRDYETIDLFGSVCIVLLRSAGACVCHENYAKSQAEALSVYAFCLPLFRRSRGQWSSVVSRSFRACLIS
jgi:hypothetical protein